MPIPTPKGGPIRIPADSTAGQRGLPARRAQSGGPDRFEAPEAPEGQEIGSDVRGGPTSGRMYELPLTRRTPTSGDGTGQ